MVCESGTVGQLLQNEFCRNARRAMKFSLEELGHRGVHREELE